jgi:hypothetical protein
MNHCPPQDKCQSDVKARKPTKADIVRMQRIVKEWSDEEDLLCARYGNAIKGTLRAKRIKDRDALLRILSYVYAL